MKTVKDGDYNGYPATEVETSLMDFIDFIKIPVKERPLVLLDERIFFHVGGDQFILNDFRKATDESSYINCTPEKVEVIISASIINTDLPRMFWCDNFEPIIREQKKIPYKTYIIHDQSADIYKIGKSMNPSKRIYNLEQGNLSLMTVLIIDLDIEELLHAEYHKKRVGGEWFALSADDIIDLYNTYKDNIITDNRP